jgi:hypothetical protein
VYLYSRPVWHYAAWGLAGAAINRALIYLEASQRSKGPPWRPPQGPGGGFYLISVILHCGIGSVVTWAAAQSHLVPSALVALGMGATAPVVVKKASAFTLTILPRTTDDEAEGEADAS